MIEIEECIDLFLKNINPVSETELIPLTKACKRVAAEDVCVVRPVPAFPRSAMDGYAVYAADTSEASRENPVILNVLGENCAGDSNEYAYVKNSAVRVMTGAYIPEGFNSVIRQEDTDYGEKEVAIYSSTVPYANFSKVGEDMQTGETIAENGTMLTPLHIGLLASAGVYKVNVYRQLRIAVISTGSELVPLGEALEKGKIYNSILYILKSAMEKEGFDIVYEKICADDETKLAGMLAEAAECADIVITTGGVSVGKRDLLPSVLDKVGAKRLFTRANIQPGTPTIGSILKGKPVLSLSGNPYAAIANFEIYFWEIAAAMLHCDSYKPVIKTARLESDYPKVNKMRRLVRAYEDGGKVILPVSTHASSVISNMTCCNCFLDLPAGMYVCKGDLVSIRQIKM